jgi:hypothetical protein
MPVPVEAQAEESTLFILADELRWRAPGVQRNLNHALVRLGEFAVSATALGCVAYAAACHKVLRDCQSPRPSFLVVDVGCLVG